MIFWIKNILIPYLDSASITIDKEISPLSLFDNLKAHLTEEVLDLLKANSIRIRPLPPHSSHFLQVLDLSFFGTMKDEIKNIETTMLDKKNKMSCKIEKVLKSYFSTFCFQ